MNKIPVTLVTGFLGAGKSTLINRIMAEHPGISFGVVLNEFGDVSLESQIIEAGKNEITELANGCMCCVVQSDLISAVQGLLARNPKISHIILEASGLSDPVPIAATFLNDTLDDLLRFDSILCVVDAVNFLDSIEDYLIAIQQVAYADYILLSKTEGAEGLSVDRTVNFIRAQNPKARIHELNAAFLTDLVVDVSNLSHDTIASLEIEEHHHHHGEQEHREDEHHVHLERHADKRVYHHVHQEVDTFFFKTESPLDLNLFNDFLELLPRTIYRAKGFLYFNDSRAAGRKYLLQLVGDRRFMEMKYWKDREVCMSAMIFVGKDFDQRALESQLRACEVDT